MIEGELVLPGRGLSNVKESIERDVIKLALEQAHGSVTIAARHLGVSFQALSYMLETRHKDLLKYVLQCGHGNAESNLQI